MNKKWIDRFYQHAIDVAKWSKDKNTKVGCVIVNEDKNILTCGYNGFPRGANDDDFAERYEKPLKYMWTEHAERNAIYNATRNGVSLNNSIAFVTYFPCSDCARALIQVGVKRVYSPMPDFKHKKWGDSWQTSKDMFTECGVELFWV